jgi:hypothetical protein
VEAGGAGQDLYTHLLLERVHRWLKTLACHREMNPVEPWAGLLSPPFLLLFISSLPYNTWKTDLWNLSLVLEINA